jgi:hypothetical protein
MKDDLLSPPSTRETGLRYGAVLGLISILYFVFLAIYRIDTTQGIGRWATLIFNLALLILAHQYFKRSGDGFMSYKQGITIAFWVALISSLMFSAFFVLYIQFIDTDFMEIMEEVQRQALIDQNISEEQIDQAMKLAKSFQSPWILFTFGVVVGIISQLIFALITTIFTKKENPNPPWAV